MLEISENTLLFMLPVFGAVALVIGTIVASAMSVRPGDERPRRDDTDRHH
ncbi:MAG: hypothetical protein ACPHCI_05530 [Solirubrobacterales bacterium]